MKPFTNTARSGAASGKEWGLGCIESPIVFWLIVSSIASLYLRALWPLELWFWGFAAKREWESGYL